MNEQELIPEVTYEAPEQYVPQDETEKTITEKESNFKNLRAQNEELQRRIRDLEAKSAPRYADPDDDELVSRKDIKALKQQLHEQQIRMKLPDYDKVVNNDTLEKLKAEDPYLAYSIGMNPDPYSQSVAVYNAIKKFGLHQEEQYDKEHEVTNRNISKPRSTNAISPQKGASPLTHAHEFGEGRLTEEQLDQYRREMEQFRRR